MPLDELLSAFQGLDKSTTILARPYFDNDFPKFVVGIILKDRTCSCDFSMIWVLKCIKRRNIVYIIKRKEEREQRL